MFSDWRLEDCRQLDFDWRLEDCRQLDFDWRLEDCRQLDFSLNHRKQQGTLRCSRIGKRASSIMSPAILIVFDWVDLKGFLCEAGMIVTSIDC